MVYFSRFRGTQQVSVAHATSRVADAMTDVVRNLFLTRLQDSSWKISQIWIPLPAAFSPVYIFFFFGGGIKLPYHIVFIHHHFLHIYWQCIYCNLLVYDSNDPLRTDCQQASRRMKHLILRRENIGKSSILCSKSFWNWAISIKFPHFKKI